LKGFYLINELLDRFDGGICWAIREDRRMKAIVKEEGSKTCSRMDVIVVGKLC
jgi:hypothetical protein